MSTPIERSKYRQERDTFCRLTALLVKNDWLIQKHEALSELWACADTDVKKKLLESLINNFCYVDDNKHDCNLSLIVDNIENVWKLNPCNTLMFAASKNSHPDGSQYLIQMLKNRFNPEDGWLPPHFFNTINKVEDEILDFYKEDASKTLNIVIIDDFVGTGGTIEKRVKKVRKIITICELDNVNIFVTGLAAMRFSLQKLENLGIRYYFPIYLDKGISELSDPDDRQSFNEAMNELESMLAPEVRGSQLKKVSFGYGRSEGLYALKDLNVPNNVFPIFWWPKFNNGTYRITLFKRL